MSNRKIILIIISICLVFGITGQVYALTFPTENYVRYGDFWSYSLPILNIINGYDPKGGPYTIDSSPGQIKDDVIIYTGAKGTPITTNAQPDNAYLSSTGTDTYFSTVLAKIKKGNTTYFFDPGDIPFVADFTGDTLYTWDVQLNDLTTYLGDSDLLFFFNNNQTGSGISESLYAWGRATLVDIDGGCLPSLYFDFTNDPLGGEANGDVTNYTSTGAPVPQPGGSLPVDQNYVFVPGEVLYLGQTIDHNLGAVNAAYALFSPEINNILKMPGFNGYDVMQIDMRLDMLNDGYEQLFIQAGHNVTNVTEPSTLILLGSGLLGLGFYARRRRPKL